MGAWVCPACKEVHSNCQIHVNHSKKNEDCWKVYQNQLGNGWQGELLDGPPKVKNVR